MSSKNSSGHQLMEVDKNSRPLNRSSHNGMNGGVGLSGSLSGSLPNVAAGNAENLRNGSMLISAGIRVGSPIAGRRGLQGNVGASVTRVIRPDDDSTDTVSTTILRPTSGGAEGATVHPNFSAQPGVNSASHALGVVTIEQIKDEAESHKQENGTAGQKEEFGCGDAGNHNPHYRLGTVPQKPVIPEPPKPQTFPIYVRNTNGKNHTFLVSKTTTVDYLLALVSEWIGIPTQQFWLSCGSGKLTSGKTLDDFGIQENNTIFVQQRLRGG